MPDKMNKIKAMQHAGIINQSAIQQAIMSAVPGVSLLQLDGVIEKTIRLMGGVPAFKGYKNFPGSACLSPNDIVVHGVPDNYILKKGDILTIDVGTKYNGYCVDAARTIIVGQSKTITDEQEYQNFLLVYAAKSILKKQLSVVKDGCSLLDIVNAAIEPAERFGVYIFPEWGGHQIGKTIHESLDGASDGFIPNVLDLRHSDLNLRLQKHKYQYKLREGQTICIEPVVTFGSGEMIMDGDWLVKTKDGAYTAHEERCILVTKHGHEVLS